MNIGLVFEGGGGKGAYQIGAWKAIRELGLERYIKCVSGTSVGALNAALFYMGSLDKAEQVWSNISDDDIFCENGKEFFENGDCVFTQEKLEHLIAESIQRTAKVVPNRKCYVTCRYRDKNEYRYFKWSDVIDIELKKKILLASSAIPILFKGVTIDGEWYIDGGVNGDNI